MTMTNRPDYGQMRTLREAVGPGFSFVGPSEQILRTVIGTAAGTGAGGRVSGRS